MSPHPQLTRRERQIMEVVYARGEASVDDVLHDLSDAPSRTTLRTLLRILEEKGHVVHTLRGRSYIYRPVRSRLRAGLSDLKRVLKTYFDGSLESALAAHFSDPSSELSSEELRRLNDLIQKAKQEQER